MSHNIGDPLERARQGKLGGKKPQPTEEHNDIKTSQHNGVSMSDGEANTPTKTNADMKRTTIYMPKSLALWLKMYAVSHEEDMSGIVIRELENLRRREEGK
jgi:hypothetical protein